jgi:hypothetical protein
MKIRKLLKNVLSYRQRTELCSITESIFLLAQMAVERLISKKSSPSR